MKSAQQAGMSQEAFILGIILMGSFLRGTMKRLDFFLSRTLRVILSG